MKKLRNIIFLKDVLLYTLTAFGGPQGHFALMLKRFVKNRQYIAEQQLIEYNSFCQFIPGPTSTQLLGIVAYKKGGFWIAICALIIWILPAAVIMGALSFLVLHQVHQAHIQHIFRFLQPITLAFFVYATIRYFKTSITNTITTVILVFSIALTLNFLKTPWLIPLLLIAAGFVTNLSNKRFPDTKETKQVASFNWRPLFLFFLIFIIAGWLSETAKNNNWNNRKQLNLFENNYRFGSLVFGGGDVLLPLMIDQYVERPNSKKIKRKNPNVLKIDKDQLINGFALVKAIPGPIFSVSSYIGGIAMANNGPREQLIGCIIGAVSIFLPSLILLFFLIPLWDKIRGATIIYRSLEGINAAVTGVMMATAIYLMEGAILPINSPNNKINIAVICFSLLLLIKTKTPAPIIVLIGLAIGYLI